MPKEGSHCICLSAIFIDSVLKIGNNYYPAGILETCKYIVKERKVEKFIVDDIETSSAESDKESIHE